MRCAPGWMPVLCVCGCVLLVLEVKGDFISQEAAVIRCFDLWGDPVAVCCIGQLLLCLELTVLMLAFPARSHLRQRGDTSLVHHPLVTWPGLGSRGFSCSGTVPLTGQAVGVMD